MVCLRSAAYWGLKPGERYGCSLFAPKVTRGGNMYLLPLRESVVEAVAKAVLEPAQ